MPENYTRRKFIRDSAIAGTAASVIDTPLKVFAAEKKSTVRMGMLAVGLRGQSHLEEMLKRNDVEVVAMADPDKGMMASAQKLVAKYGKKAPAEFSNGPNDYKNLLKRNDIDAVIIASPWEWHIPMGIDAMNAGKMMGMEFGGEIKWRNSNNI